MSSEMKGLSIRNYPIVLRQLRGDATTERVLELVSPALREALATSRIVASGWYPVAWKCELHAAALKVTGEAGLAWRMGSEMTKRDLRGIYRTFVRVLSPRYVLSMGARLFSTYLRPGSMKVLEARDGFTRVSFAGCEGFDRNLWQDVLGGCEGTLELAGAQYVRLHVESGAGNDDENAVIVAWWTMQ